MMKSIIILVALLIVSWPAY
ncbi:type I toxin-antitoxin system Ibs family toxin [Franconibacter helveticus]